MRKAVAVTSFTSEGRRDASPAKLTKEHVTALVRRSLLTATDAARLRIVAEIEHILTKRRPQNVRVAYFIAHSYLANLAQQVEVRS